MAAPASSPSPGRDGAFRETRILVTGGLGFIGSNLARRLIDLGARVSVVDASLEGSGANPHNLADVADRVTILRGDLRDARLAADAARDQSIVFNLAGLTGHQQSMERPQEDLAHNGQAQLALLDACRKSPTAPAVVFTSTRQVYGRPAYLPVDEAHPIAPPDVNAVHKVAAEAYHRLFQQVYGLPASILRLTNTYGPRMRIADASQMFLGLWIRLVLEGKPFKIFGDGNQRRDFNFVDDAVDALLLCASHPQARGQTFNLGAAHPTTLRGLADLLIQTHGSGRYELVPFPTERARIDIGDCYSSYQHIRTTLGWEPRVLLADGLSRTLQFYRQHQARYLEARAA